ncbi:membrane hypothetical protein [Candidatus Methanoperedens nitroreducens]|uniref:Uncharacterized protein n=1 Tax=Candidatus Methanoperedens nitratireducens TaxID=1392998 RepID=A0A284VNV5_9EURY|nr:membrane hypothetical protein [Candidatus Methanoperedens nitroreducens]
MINRPALFIALNIILYFIALSLWGFEASLYVLIAITIFIIAYNFKYVGLKNSLSLSIVYLLVFDSAFFSFTSFKFRIWYPLLLIVMFLQIAEYLMRNDSKIKLKKNSVFIYSVVLLLLAYSFIYFIFETTEFKLHIIKYWLFSVGLIIVLFNSFKTFERNYVRLLDYLISIFVFVCIWGLIQFFF